MDNQILVPIELIDGNPYQPRQTEDPAAIAEIAESIQRNGLMQVPSARQVDGRYQLAFGHTRLAAFKLLQEECMPLIVRELDDLQMFELGVSENIKRRDLNPIEQAEAMRRYMDEFNKNSVETGEFFNVSEEQVRGTVRLINLVPEAQEGLAAGKFNITTARSLLSMQKIAPRAAIAETVKQIEKGVNRYGSAETPEEIIEDSIRRLEETVRMWNDNRDGKPRSTDNYNEPGWLLSNKSFPNKLLPKLSAEQIAIALGVQADEEICKLIDAAFAGWGWSDDDWEKLIYPDLRKRLANHPDLLQKFEHLLNPPACTACPFYTRINGSHYCGMKACHTRKNIAWHAHILQQAVNNLRIPLYDKKDGKYQILTYEHEKLFTARNKDLRLIPRDQVRGYHYQHFTGVEDAVFLVVMTGKTLENKTAAIKEVRAQEKAQETAQNTRERLRGEMRVRLYWEATYWLKAMFEAMNPPAVETFLDLTLFDTDPPSEEIEEVDEKAPAEERAEYVRRTLAYAMLEEADSFDLRRSWTTAAQIAAWLGETAKGWGIPLPRAFFKIAEQLDEEIQAVTAETPKKNGKGKK